MSQRKFKRQAKHNLGLHQVMVWIPMGAAYRTSLEAKAEELCKQHYMENELTVGEVISMAKKKQKEIVYNRGIIINDKMQTDVINSYAKNPPGSAIKTLKYWLSVNISDFKGQMLNEDTINRLSEKIGSRIGYRLQDIYIDEDRTIVDISIVAAWDWKPL